jgi:hypothetical protein
MTEGQAVMFLRTVPHGNNISCTCWHQLASSWSAGTASESIPFVTTALQQSDTADAGCNGPTFVIYCVCLELTARKRPQPHGCRLFALTDDA